PRDAGARRNGADPGPAARAHVPARARGAHLRRAGRGTHPVGGEAPAGGLSQRPRRDRLRTLVTPPRATSRHTVKLLAYMGGLCNHDRHRLVLLTDGDRDESRRTETRWRHTRPFAKRASRRVSLPRRGTDPLVLRRRPGPASRGRPGARRNPRAERADTLSAPLLRDGQRRLRRLLRRAAR